MRTFLLITLSLSFCISLEASELSSSQSQAAQTRAMRFSSSDFQGILLDLAVIAGIVIVGKKLPEDKKKHFYAGALTGAVVGKWCQRSQRSLSTTQPKRRNFMCSLGAATAVGILKEVYDSTGRGNVEFKDALVTSAGGAAAGLLFL